MGNEEKGFASRWSKRKSAARQELEPEAKTEELAELDLETEGLQRQKSGDDELLTEADFDDVDFDALDKSSDYTRFTKANVPAEIQKKALRKLWDSDSVFEVLDGMNDYDEDFTGDGLAGKIFKTAHKVGRGFITDEDDKVAEIDPENIKTETETEEAQEDITQEPDGEAPDDQTQETLVETETTKSTT